MDIIAVEEHFMHETLTRHFAKMPPEALSRRLFDLGEFRIGEMDEAGIAMQVLSHQSPGAQQMGGDDAVSACRLVNDALASVISRYPDRFAGFAMLPTDRPDEAAEELARATGELGLKGAMLHGLSNGRFLDDPAFLPIFARAEALGVPIYIHPAYPDRTVVERYYAPFDESHPGFVQAGWGFGVEAGTQAIRLVLSGLFEKHPGLKIILGHLGEGLPFWLDRIDEALARPGGAPVRFAETLRRNFWVTTSGFFSDRALTCTLDALGVDRVMFAVDWPYASNTAATDWLRRLDLGGEDRAAIAGGIARRLLGL